MEPVGLVAVVIMVVSLSKDACQGEAVRDDGR